MRSMLKRPMKSPDVSSRKRSPILLQANIRLAESLGAEVVKLKGRNVADELLRFACESEITHVIFGQSARSRSGDNLSGFGHQPLPERG